MSHEAAAESTNHPQLDERGTAAAANMTAAWYGAIALAILSTLGLIVTKWF